MEHSSEEVSGTVPSSSSDISYVDQFISEGKNLLQKKDFYGAQTLFSTALEAQVGKYGDMGVECAETYYLYGQALLSGAKTEGDMLVSQMLGGQMPEQDDEDFENPEESISLAWEVFEIARVLFSRMEGKEMEVTRVRLDLGQLKLEIGDINAGLEELKQAHDLSVDMIPKDENRKSEWKKLLTEIRYWQGMAFELERKHVEALETYKKVSEDLKERLKELEGNLDEQKEVEGIIDEVREKIEILESTKNEVVEEKQGLKRKREETEEDGGNKRGKFDEKEISSCQNGKGKEKEIESGIETKVNFLGTFGTRTKTSTAPVQQPVSASGTSNAPQQESGSVTFLGVFGGKQRDSDLPPETDL